jgi:Ca2+-binding RTX toxin-like protein
VPKLTGSFLETLETRRLFAGVVLDGRVLVITGTNQPDNIVVALSSSSSTPEKLQVRVNQQITEFNRADVKAVHIEAYGGDDRITINGGLNDSDAVNRIWGHAGHDHINVSPFLTTRIWGGGGNDDVKTSNAPDWVYGEEGNDTVRSQWGPDRLFGGEGNDVLDGSAGVDYLDGADGDDMITGGGGDDHLFGGAGNDVLRGNHGNDDLHAGVDADIDLLFGGSGADVFDGDTNEDADVEVGEIPIL